MNLHEYQSKQLFAEYELPVLRGFLAYTPGEVRAAADRLGGFSVVKAQVHAGGRGKGGGVKVCKTSDDAHAAATKILGMNLITPQTGSKGKLVSKVYVEEGCNIDREFYFSMLVNRDRRCISIIASAEGGMDIEELAHKAPNKIVRIDIEPSVGFQSFHGLKLANAFELTLEASTKLTAIVRRLYCLFVEQDLSLLEVNPLVLTKEGGFIVLDAKCAIDDNALFRQPKLSMMLDYDELDPRDLEANKLGLSYVGLDGDIGCMVNGAGLAMATMDIIKSYGGEPANFLDVGGGATKEKVTEAFKLILSDKSVKGILVNIFGGIMKCDLIAEGIVVAAKELALTVPLVVRLQGTNVELGRKILADSKLNLVAADTMSDAAQKIVKLVG